MAKSDFDQYYNILQQQYLDAVNQLQELGCTADNNMIDDTIVNNYKVYYNQIFDAYQNITYIKYLLDKPNKNSKKKRFEKQNSKKINSNKYASIVKDNQELLDKRRG